MRLECEKCGYIEPSLHEEIVTCDCNNIKSEKLKDVLRRVDEFFREQNERSKKNNNESVQGYE